MNFATDKNIVNNKDFKLNFINNIDSNDNYLTNCTLSSENQGTINCKLNENISSNYMVEDYIDYDEKSLTAIYIPDKKTQVVLNCNLQLNQKLPVPSESVNKKLMMLIIIAGGSVLLIIIITIIICCCIRRKRRNALNITNNYGANDITTNNIQNEYNQNITSGSNTEQNI